MLWFSSTKTQRAKSLILDVLEVSKDPQRYFTEWWVCRRMAKLALKRGRGNMLVVANLEMLYTLKQLEVDVDHLWFATCCDTKAKAAHVKFDIPLNHIIRYSNTGCTTREDFQQMKDLPFKAIIMNPPYSGDQTNAIKNTETSQGRRAGTSLLHLRFMESALHQLAETVVCICPIAQWFGRDARSNKDFYHGTFHHSGLFHAEWWDEELFPSHSIKGGLGIFAFNVEEPNAPIEIYRQVGPIADEANEHIATIQPGQLVTFENEQEKQIKDFMSGRDSLSNIHSNQDK